MRLLFYSFFISFISFAQTPQPVKWDAVFDSKDSSVVFTALIEKNWHIYSQTPSLDGPIPTTFVFEKNESYLRIDTVMEQIPEKKMDEAFGVNVLYFNEKAVFKQKIKPTSNSFTIDASVEFMVCNNATCLPPSTVKFKIPILIPAQTKAVTTSKPQVKKAATKSKKKK